MKKNIFLILLFAFGITFGSCIKNELKGIQLNTNPFDSLGPNKNIIESVGDTIIYNQFSDKATVWLSFSIIPEVNGSFNPDFYRIYFNGQFKLYRQMNTPYFHDQEKTGGNYKYEIQLVENSGAGASRLYILNEISM
ncbi:hypothetical protein LBMAG27_13660 [Bacteroidota bacterium]|nr:hypothetical protein LBMAG27_13660 [Bacteroidota bacterium]